MFRSRTANQNGRFPSNRILGRREGGIRPTRKPVELLDAGAGAGTRILHYQFHLGFTNFDEKSTHQLGNRLLPRLCWIAHERRRDLARFDGSWDSASMMFQPCFLAVETKERISAKSIAPCNDRKPPEIF